MENINGALMQLFFPVHMFLFWSWPIVHGSGSRVSNECWPWRHPQLLRSTPTSNHELRCYLNSNDSSSQRSLGLWIRASLQDPSQPILQAWQFTTLRVVKCFTKDTGYSKTVLVALMMFIVPLTRLWSPEWRGLSMQKLSPTGACFSTPLRWSEYLIHRFYE